MKNLTGEYLASLSMNQIYWDGDLSHLPSWDDVAGDPTDYSQTYNPNGNTLVLMSMNVAPSHQGKQLPARMIDKATDVAKQLGITHFLGSFRPSGYGEAKKGLGFDLDFEEYVLKKQSESDKPVDPWLRSLWWKGMQILKVDPKAMTVKVALDQFYNYQQSYKPGFWVMVKQGIWECGEVGSWKLDMFNGVASYQESNVWGKMPL